MEFKTWKEALFAMSMLFGCIWKIDTQQKLHSHSWEFKTLSPFSSLQQTLKSGNTRYFLPWALNRWFIISIKHVLISDGLLASFYAVSALSEREVMVFWDFNLYWPMNVRHISICLFYILQAIRVFLLLRDLCLLIRNEEETQLPLNKVENPVNEEDVLDLSKLWNILLKANWWVLIG